ncbi:sensor histidine kinase [Brevibacillus fluminis]|uniref:sensor histidine kinase n=1 Tax=Brevibacillus fluminis TaxID=511487 RepID=UPI003F8CC7DF
MKTSSTRFFSINRRSLRYQVLSRTLFLLAGLLLLIGFFQYVLMKDFLMKNMVMSIKSQIQSVPFEIWREGVENKSYVPFQLMRLPDVTLAFIDAKGTFTDLLGSAGHGKPPQLPLADYQQALAATRDEPPLYRIHPDEYGINRLLILQSVGVRGKRVGVVQVTTSMRGIQDVLMRQMGIFLLLSAAALLGGFLTFRPVLRRILVPLSTMVQQVEQIDAAKLDQRLHVKQGLLEADQLSSAFNALLARLAQSFQAEQEAKENMRRFVADASHELRTPLTSIHGFLEVLLRGAAANPAQLDDALHSMYCESERVNKLVNDLLFLAKVDRAPSIHLTNGRLDQIIAQMEAQLLLLAGSRRVEFDIRAERESRFDQDRIKQVILNLFQNAVQHTDAAGGVIGLSLWQDSDCLVLAVKDNGTGIGQEHLPHLFDRFYRIDSARTRKSGGTGLGLSITRSIVELHGGTIEVTSEEKRGTQFTVRLPVSHDS